MTHNTMPSHAPQGPDPAQRLSTPPRIGGRHPAPRNSRPAADARHPTSRQAFSLARAGTAPGDRVRVLVCDDHEVYRLGLRAVLEAAGDITLVGETTDPGQALLLHYDACPHVALVGQDLCGGGALELIRRLGAQGTGVVVLAESDARHDVVDALRAGARGYLHRRVSPLRLIDGIRAVARNETALDSTVAEYLLPYLDHTVPGPAPSPVPALTDGLIDALGARLALPGVPVASPAASGTSMPPPTGAPDPEAPDLRAGPASGPLDALLTRRQRVVAALVADGLSNAEIAARLYLSPATVKSHLTIILRRLELRDRTQLAILVNRQNQLDSSDPTWG